MPSYAAGLTVVSCPQPVWTQVRIKARSARGPGVVGKEKSARLLQTTHRVDSSARRAATRDFRLFYSKSSKKSRVTCSATCFPGNIQDRHTRACRTYVLISPDAPLTSIEQIGRKTATTASGLVAPTATVGVPPAWSMPQSAGAPSNAAGVGQVSCEEKNNNPGSVVSSPRPWPGSDFKLDRFQAGSVYLWACGERDQDDGEAPVTVPEAVAAWVILLVGGKWSSSFVIHTCRSYTGNPCMQVVDMPPAPPPRCGSPHRNEVDGVPVPRPMSKRACAAETNEYNNSTDSRVPCLIRLAQPATEARPFLSATPPMGINQVDRAGVRFETGPHRTQPTVQYTYGYETLGTPISSPTRVQQPQQPSRIPGPHAPSPLL